MDSVLRDTLTANLKAAKTPEERDNALTLAMIAMIDCQHKTAPRAKSGSAKCQPSPTSPKRLK